MTEEAAWERTNIRSVIHFVLARNKFIVGMLSRNAHLRLLQEGCTNNSIAGQKQFVCFEVESVDVPIFALLSDIPKTVTDFECSFDLLALHERCNGIGLLHITVTSNLHDEMAVEMQWFGIAVA